MRVGAFLAYIARLKGVEGDDLDARISESLERVGLPGIERKRCDELSKGMSQKVQFIAAIIHKPDLLILDEPFSGLDPVSMRMLRDMILEEHGRGATVLFSTHIMPQAEEICEHVVMVYQGKKVLDEEIGLIRSNYDPRAIQFDPLDPEADASPLLSLTEVESLKPKDRGYDILLREGADPSTAMRRIMDRVPAARIELARPRLEDVFIQLVSANATDDEVRLRKELEETNTKGATM